MIPATTETTKAILEGLTALFSTSRRWLLFFGSGTSCALDPRLGMSSLTEHLTQSVGDAVDWHKVQSRLEAGQSLEQALNRLFRTNGSQIQLAAGQRRFPGGIGIL